MNHDQSAQKYPQLGRDIVMENLRMLCVFKSETKLKRFFNYVDRVHQICGDRITKDCHEKAMNSFTNNKLYERVNTCISDSFEKSGPEFDSSLDDNNHLRDMLLEWNNYGSHLYPSVVINSITFRGQLNPYNVFEAICAGYKDTPPECVNFLL
jgi:hypothetical protein